MKEFILLQVVYDADQFALGDTIENWTIEVTDSAGNKSTSSFRDNYYQRGWN